MPRYAVITMSAVMLAGNALGQKPRLAGDWTYEVAPFNLVNEGKAVKCEVAGSAIRIRESGGILGGFAHGGTFRCGTDVQPIQEAPVDSGSTRGDSVFFQLGPNKHRGRVHENLISGELAIADGNKWIKTTFVMKRVK